ncbi:hypothetical protein GW846_04555 [Candidatus Gracilibacteria bacterium]|nr:hypothetical protein [Candidatus Gracilibacteria bacterium]
MKLSTILFVILCIVGTLYHAYFLQLNEVLKVADSFAYLQMSYFMKDFSIASFGNGWFGFVYSIPIALMNLFIINDFLAAQIVNLILLNVSAILLFNISKKYLSSYFSLLVVGLFLLSPVYLHFSIHVLSENIYIPLFLGLLTVTLNFVEECYIFKSPSQHLLRQKKQVIIIGVLLALLYLTRAEAFIYIGSIGILALGLALLKKLKWKNFFSLGILFFVSFIIIISPYLYFLHDLTGEWGLTNKGASNLRQAELRGQTQMDDAGFEQAVAELTADKHHLIAGFAGGMPYDTPSIEGSLGDFVARDPAGFIARVFRNQIKLFTQNIPEIFLGKSPSLYLSDNSRFGGNILFLLWCLFPFLVLLYGIYESVKRERVLILTSLAFFTPALIFFTLFFTLNRYFLIFLPLFFLIYGIGLAKIYDYSKILSLFLIGNIVSVLLLSTMVYYNGEKDKDDYYTLKQEAGVWLQGQITDTENIKIMERFPIVTYYSGSKIRYITPYTDDISDIYEYGLYNKIDYLIVDSMDFETYRPALAKYLENTPNGFTKFREFSNAKNQKVIIYKLNEV